MTKDDEFRRKGLEFQQFEQLADQVLAGSKTHPGFAESLIPIWGSAREAVADAQEGDWAGAALNGALAVADAIPGAMVGRALGKGTAVYVAKKGAAHGGYTWPQARRWMNKTSQLAKGENGHHWAIRNEWPVPGWIKNQPANIKGLDAVTHGRIHGPYTVTDAAGNRTKLPRFNPLERYWHGTPTWWKVRNATDAGHVAAFTKGGLERDKDEPAASPNSLPGGRVR